MANETEIVSITPQNVTPEHLFKALANSTRMRMLRRLAEGGALCVNDFVSITRRKQEAVSRHLVILARAGAAIQVPAPDGDGRKQFYAIRPSVVRTGPTGNELDFGTCTVRLS